MLAEIFVSLDDMILEKRDKLIFRFKVFKHTCIKTIMDPVDFDRRVYKYIDEFGKKSYRYLLYRYLLDKYLSIETIGHMYANLVAKSN